MSSDPAEQLAWGSPLTLQQWGELAEDAEGEVVDGRLVEDEMTDYVHEVVVSFLIGLLRGWARARGGFVGGSEAKFAVSETRGRKADLSVYLPGGPKPRGRGVLDVPPGILVEVVSTRPRDARRDRVEKLHEYARFGVKYYWIVDPQLRTIEIFERGEDARYVMARSSASGRIDDVPGCPGLVIDLDALWAEVDELDGDAE